MTPDPDAAEVAAALQVSIGLLVRRLRQVQGQGDLSLPESSALARLDRGGPATPSALARLEQISPQSMGATVAALEARDLVERHADPGDGRHVVLSLTEAGRHAVRERRGARTVALTEAMRRFSGPELAALVEVAPLLERLAQEL